VGPYFFTKNLPENVLLLVIAGDLKQEAIFDLNLGAGSA
jgi:hypothetical protein